MRSRLRIRELRSQRKVHRRVWHLSVTDEMLDHHIDQIPHELKQAHVHRGW